MNPTQIEEFLQQALQGRYTVKARRGSADSMDIVLRPTSTGRATMVLHAQRRKNGVHGHRQDYRLWILNHSPFRLANELRARNESFLDVTRGHVYLSLPEILVDRVIALPRHIGHEEKAKSPATRPLRDPFADRASLLSRVLLDSPGREWMVTGLATAAGVSAMVSTHVIRQFEDWRIVQIRREGRKVLARLVAPRLLIETWATQYNWKRNPALAIAAPLGDEERFLRRFAEAMGKAGRRCALTLLSGAWRRIQYTSPDRIHIYVDVASPAELRDLASELGWMPDISGNVILMQPHYRDSVWHNLSMSTNSSMNSKNAIANRTVPVVSDVQLIVDLWNYPIRGRETAEQLLRPLEGQFTEHGPPPHTAA